jgi:predicted metal-binding membrane protein
VCFGCCWLLFVLLFPLGVMNIAVMALVTAFIFAEKVFSLGRWVRLSSASVLIAYGILVLVVPRALPGMM